MEPEDFLYTMSREVDQAEMHRKTPRWELVVYLIGVALLFAIEVFLINPR